MTNAAQENQGIVLFGADGTKYVIPMDVLSAYAVPEEVDLPDPDAVAASPDITSVQAYQAPITQETDTAFFFVGGR